MIGSAAKLRHRADRPRRLVAVHLGHHDVHQDEVDVGVGLAAPRAPSRPFSAKTHVHPVRLQRARQREDVAHVVVDDQHLAARQHGVGLVQLLEHPPALGAAAPPAAGAGAAPSRRAAARASAASLTMIDSGVALQARLLAPGQRLAGVDDHRHVAVALVGLDALEQLRSRSPSGSLRSSTMQSKRVVVERARAPPRSSPTAADLDVVAADQRGDAASRSASSSSSTTSTPLGRRSLELVGGR